MRSAVRLLCVLLLLTASAWGADPAILRGVYSDWSVVLQTAGSEAGIPAATTRRIQSMSRTNVNLVWWTNLPDDPVRLAQIVRESRTLGIEIVAGSGRWYAGARSASQQIATLTALNAALPADARPWRWSLGDETTPAALTDLRTIADACATAGIPTAMVQVPEYHAQTLTTLGNRVPVVSCDVYPFFQPNLPSNPPYGPAALTWFKTTADATVGRSLQVGVRPLLMTQGFGGDATFAMPTPARTRWQVWSAVASGSPGAIVFAHGMPSPDGGPTPPMASLVDWQRTTETLTPAGIAVRDTFTRVKSIESLIAGSTIETGPAITLPAAGDVSAYVRMSNGKRLLLVVSDPDQPTRSLKMTLPGVAGVTPLAGSTGGTFTVLPWPWFYFFPGTMSVTLPAGEAWIGELR